MLKAQLRLGETPEDRQRFESDAEAVRQAKAAEIPEYRHYYGNWGIRIPMEIRAQQSAGKLLLLIEFDADIDPANPAVAHEIEHHTEKMNQAVALAARRDL